MESETAIREIEDIFKKDDSPTFLEFTGRTMTIELIDSSIKIEISEKPGLLLHKIRHLNLLGCKIPDNVRTHSEVVQKHYRLGVILKQVSDFYNTILLQAVDCQKGMLTEF